MVLQMNENDLRFLRKAIDAARKARDKGNHPFGAVLVTEGSKFLMDAENTVVTGKDPTGHAEINLIRRAARQYEIDYLAKCTLYTSTEPCPMCAGAIFWANVRRVVYGLSEESLYEMIGEDNEEVLYLPCREIFAKGKKQIEVIGPLIEEEAREVHLGFWR
jgi:tRNA(Arg) A34 adenosine deaminase TadA